MNCISGRFTFPSPLASPRIKPEISIRPTCAENDWWRRDALASVTIAFHWMTVPSAVAAATTDGKESITD
jgi:hypothetical protein